MKSSREEKIAQLSPARRRTFLLVTFFMPVALLVLLELFLRLVHYGPDLSLFRPETLHGKTYLQMNPEVKGRYFHQVDFNPSTSPDRFEAQKPPGTYRIFCLGASTTVGYPYWFNGSFSTFLRDRLRATFPGRSIEVINLGMTATNSYTVTDIARELPSYQPDCIIVYDGHNEFYGAMGISSHETLGRSRWINRLYLRLVRYRTFVLMRDIVSAIAGLFHKSQEDRLPATMMERLSRGQYVAYGSDIYRQGLNVFRENLVELRGICAGSGIPLILSTQVSNLRRQPPFISNSGSQIPGDRVAFNITFNDGIAEYLNGDFLSALMKLRSLTGRDTLRGDLRFRIAQCLDTLTRYPEAAQEYARARDFDELRFRASGDFNNVIRAMEDGKRVFVADVEREFSSASPDSLIGNEFITEHLHPNLRGYFMIARLYSSLMRSHVLIADPEAWRAADTLSESRLWEARNTTVIDQMIGARKTLILTSGWPFRDQAPAVPPVAETDTLGLIVELLMRDRIDWERAHLEAAAYFVRHQEAPDAAREYRVVAAELPFDADPLVRLGELLVRTGKTDQAREAFRQSLSREESARAYAGLGGIALREGAIADAVSSYEKAVQLSPSLEEQAESLYVLALLHLRSGDRDRAIQELKEVIEAAPSNRQAADLLSRIGGGKQ